MIEVKDINKDILDIITPYFVERAGNFYIEDEEYKKLTRIADLIFDELCETLTDKQRGLLERYLDENNGIVALTERLVYQQGMRDLLNLLITLLKSGKLCFSEQTVKENMIEKEKEID